MVGILSRLAANAATNVGGTLEELGRAGVADKFAQRKEERQAARRDQVRAEDQAIRGQERQEDRDFRAGETDRQIAASDSRFERQQEIQTERAESDREFRRSESEKDRGFRRSQSEREIAAKERLAKAKQDASGAEGNKDADKASDRLHKSVATDWWKREFGDESEISNFGSGYDESREPAFVSWLEANRIRNPNQSHLRNFKTQLKRITDSEAGAQALELGSRLTVKEVGDRYIAALTRPRSAQPSTSADDTPSRPPADVPLPIDGGVSP